MKLVLFIPMFLVGCSALTLEKCEDLKWFELGMADGKDGKRSHHFFAHQSSCNGKSDRKAYLKGMEQGLGEYCQSKNAFQLGLSGEAYRNICPTELEKRFLARFDLGHQIYRLKTEIEDRNVSIDEYRQQYRYGTGLTDLERQELVNTIATLEEEQKSDAALIQKLFAEAKLSGLIEAIP